MEETSPEEQKISESVVQAEMPFAVIEGTPMSQIPMDLYIGSHTRGLRGTT